MEQTATRSGSVETVTSNVFGERLQCIKLYQLKLRRGGRKKAKTRWGLFALDMATCSKARHYKIIPEDHILQFLNSVWLLIAIISI